MPRGAPGLPKKRKYYCPECLVAPKCVADCYACWELRRTTAQGRWVANNRERVNELARQSYLRDKDRHSRAVAAWQARNPELVRLYAYNNRYGDQGPVRMALEDLRRLMKEKIT